MQRYRSFLREANLRVVDPATRQQVLRDLIATLQAQAEPVSLNAAADLLKDRYDAENALTPKIAVPDIMRLLVMSGALDFAGRQACSDAPVRHVAEPGPRRTRLGLRRRLCLAPGRGGSAGCAVDSCCRYSTMAAPT